MSMNTTLTSRSRSGTRTEILDSDGNETGSAIVELRSSSLANTLGLYTPARDFYLDWFIGNDTTAATLTAATLWHGTWLDQRFINPDTRSIVIVNGNAAPDFAYTVYFSRTGTDADAYAVVTVGAGAKSTITQIVLDPATYGYDKFWTIDITPTAGQTGTELDFQVYGVGRGG